MAMRSAGTFYLSDGGRSRAGASSISRGSSGISIPAPFGQGAGIQQTKLSLMQRYIAFLRAINVGGRTVKMERLRAIVEDMGFENVATFIASGNLIFESPDKDADALERKIERGLREALGYDVVTFIRSAAELAAIAGYEPFPEADPGAGGSSLYISFLHAPPTAKTRKAILDLGSATDEFHIHRRELYWLCHTKLSDSPLFSGSRLEKALGAPSTMRNANTVRKLAAKYEPLA